MLNPRKLKMAKKDIDFQKKKLKVGKTKPQASSTTNTKLDSNSLYIPVQSILRDKANVPKTVRGLTFDDLILQTKHHNANTRKDAVNGIKELFLQNSSHVLAKSNSLFDHCLKLLLDADANVRSALLTFLKEVFRGISEDAFEAYTEKVMIYTLSSISHLLNPIRMDGVKCLLMILESYKGVSNKFKEKLFISMGYLLKEHDKNLSEKKKNLETFLTVNCTFLQNLISTELSEQIDNIYSVLMAKSSASPVITIESKNSIFIFNDKCFFNEIPSLIEEKKFLKGLFCGFLNNNTVKKESHENAYSGFICLLIQFCFDIWMEFSSELVNNKAKSEGQQYLLFVIKIMKNIFKLFHCSREYSMSDEIAQEFVKSFCKKILPRFPYSEDDQSNRGFQFVLDFEICEIIALLLSYGISDDILSCTCNFLQSLFDSKTFDRHYSQVFQALIFSNELFCETDCILKPPLYQSILHFERSLSASGICTSLVKNFLEHFKKQLRNPFLHEKLSVLKELS